MRLMYELSCGMVSFNVLFFHVLFCVFFFNIFWLSRAEKRKEKWNKDEINGLNVDFIVHFLYTTAFVDDDVDGKLPIITVLFVAGK